MAQTDVAIQIVNYKTKKFLNPLIASLVADMSSADLSYEINIIDNNSGDDICDIASTWAKNNVHVYQSEVNNGFGAGHNILAELTKAKYLLILNPDILIIEPHTIERLINRLTQARASVLGPRLLTPKMHVSEPLRTVNFEDLKQQPYDVGRDYIRSYKKIDTMSEVAWVSGAVFLIRRDDFNPLRFDERFFLYYEELDLCLRLRQDGKIVIYDPAIHVLHYGGVVAKKLSLTMVKSFIYFHFKRIAKHK